MKLVEFVPPEPHPLWKLCPQMGITEVVVKVYGHNPKSVVDRLAEAGLRVVGLEGDPFDMAPIKQYDARKDGADEAREAALEHYRELLRYLGSVGIKLLCYNFMVGTGWARTGVREGRGGAVATCFRLADVPPREGPLKLTQEQVWENYEYFIKAVMPEAERCGVRMGLHPDDPCLPELGGYGRIFGSVEAFDRAYGIYPSESNAVTFCQANFKLMGADLMATARHFGKRIAFVHMRDVEGTREDFVELFHDQGTTDQFALVRLYNELGLDVPIRGDHVPEMYGDNMISEVSIPGYSTLGRLYADGYIAAVIAGG